MIADALRCEVEAYATRMPRTNPLYARAADGTLTARHLTHYLASLHYLLACSPLTLAAACRQATARGDAALAEHFAQKLGEETGHDEWAHDDFVRMRAQASTAAKLEPCGAMRDLVAFIDDLVARDPRHYLAYALFAEYLIVLLGPDWLDLLERRCGIPRSAMTAIDRHAELDRDHAEEALDLIDSFVPDPRQLEPMRTVVQSTIELFERFCFEVLAEVDRDEERSRVANVFAA